MLSYINLILIILLTIDLVVSFVLIKRKYEKDIKEQDETLLKLFGQLNVNDEYLKDIDLKNKEEVHALITKNSNYLGENRGLIADNTGLINSVVSRLNTASATTNNNDEVVEGYQELTAEEVRTKQEDLLQKIISMQLPSSLQIIQIHLIL